MLGNLREKLMKWKLLLVAAKSIISPCLWPSRHTKKIDFRLGYRTPEEKVILLSTMWDSHLLNYRTESISIPWIHLLEFLDTNIFLFGDRFHPPPLSGLFEFGQLGSLSVWLMVMWMVRNSRQISKTDHRVSDRSPDPDVDDASLEALGHAHPGGRNAHLWPWKKSQWNQVHYHSLLAVWGHPERTSQVRGEGRSSQRGQITATFVVMMTS